VLAHSRFFDLGPDGRLGPSDRGVCVDLDGVRWVVEAFSAAL
jgi:hypothetical protein